MQIDHTETIVVGGGPAGVTCGYLLAKNNHDCLLIDRKEFPREKLCGGGLTPKAHILVNRIFGDLPYDYCSVKNMEIYSHGKYACSFALDIDIRTVLRREFDHILMKEYQKAGGKILTDRVSKIEEKDNKIYLTLASGKMLSCDRIIGADGVNSTIRKYLEPGFERGVLCLEKNIDESKGEENIKVYFDRKFKNGYLYLFPNNHGCAVGYGEIDTEADEFEQSLKELGLPDEGKTKGAYIPMYDKRKYPFIENILLIGDAGGYADTLTGEGIYYAMKSGENAALSIINGQNFKVLNRDVIDAMNRRRKMAKLFHIPPVNKLFIHMCRKPSLCRRINKRVNRELLK